MQFAYAPTTMASGLPPSPTLTNPDMILPYQPTPPSNRWQTSSSSESSPETPRQPFENFSSTSIHELRHTTSVGQANKKRLKPAGQSLSPFRNGVLSHPGGPTRARSVTERERGADGTIRFENSRLSYRPITEKVMVSPPPRINDVTTNRVIIIEDDEQSEAPTETSHVPDNTYKTPSILEEDEDNPNSHMAMSKRAEEILAIAKKRLTNMEGNLNRARSTIGSRPSSSMSSFTNGRKNEPASLYSLSNQSAKHRPTVSLDDSKANHSRGLSDSSNTDGSVKENGLGITNGENLESGKQRFWNGVTRTTSLAQRERYKALEPLNEDGPAPAKFRRASPAMTNEQNEDAAIDQGFDDLREASSPFADFDSANPPAPTITRARSTTQMRDIRDQMQDLKGKISTLKQRARQDSLYRRSLQNLRTPSPFTAAEQWYAGVPLHEERTSSVSPQPNILLHRKSSPRGSPPSAEIQPNGHIEAIPSRDRDDIGSRQLQEQDRPDTALNNKPLPGSVSPPEGNDVPVKPIQNATLSNDSLPELPPADSEESLSLMEIEDSLNGDDDQYHETSTLPIGERHEDRADAFDYEHFFLHSGMGHHKTGASRTSSRSSYSSVETTKPDDPALETLRVNGSAPSKKDHTRKDSVDSTTSFTTARSSDHNKSIASPPSTPRNIVVPPTRSDSLSYRKNATPNPKHRERRASKTSSTSSPKSNNNRRSTTGIRPPSNSFSSSHPTALATLHQKPDHPNPTTPQPAPPTSASSSPLLGYLAASLSNSTSPNLSSRHHHRSGSKPSTNTTNNTTTTTSKGGGGGSGSGSLKLSDQDTLLADRLFSSLARVCADLEAVEEGRLRGQEADWEGNGEMEGEGGGKGGKYKARMYRRQLDAARRVLDGEVNGESF